MSKQNGNTDNSRGFGTRIGYILSMAGFCIGVGNIWKFPYMVGANGGGAFLISYLVLALFIGVPLFLIEVQLGRSTQLSGIAGMRKLTGKKGSGWNAIGWISVATAFLIAVYCITLVGGWVLGYIFKVASGSLRGLDNIAIAQAFHDYSGSWICVAFSALASVGVWLIMNTGVKAGVEKVCTIAMPLLIALLIGLAIYSNTLPGAKEGLMWYLIPDFSKINLSVIQAAAVQVFFSIGVGMCCGFVYGSYIKKDSNMVSDTTSVAFLDTGIAALSGLVITPALFAFGIEPTTGSSLIFVTLPQMFNAMPAMAGTIFGLIFLVAIFLAGVTTIVGLLEAVQANVMDALGWSRKKTNTIVTSVAFIFSVVSTLSQGNGMLSHIRVFGMDFFSLFDTVSSAFGLTIGAVLMLAFMIFKWGFKNFQEEANAGVTGKLRIFNWMKPYYQIFLPLALVFVSYGVIAAYFF